MSNTTQHDMGNNEVMSTGVDVRGPREFCALTLSESKTFKTFKGAAAWLARRGYNADGTRMEATA